MQGYNFTERTRKVLSLAQDEARRLRHEYIGTEHILLGLVLEGEGVAAAVLLSLDIDLEQVVRIVEKTVNSGKKASPGEALPYTSRAKKVLELAVSEARELNHSYVGTEHLLLGLVAEQKGIGAQVLADCGLELAAARAETLRLLGADVPPPPGRERLPHGEMDSNFDPAAVMKAGAAGYRVLNRCTPRLRTVVLAAVDKAHSRSAFAIEPEHLLEALLEQEDGMAAAILDRVSADRRKLRDAAARAAGEIALVDSRPEPTPFSAVALVVLRDAHEAAKDEGANDMGTDHLLLALMETGNERTVDVLANAGVTIEALVRERERLIG